MQETPWHDTKESTCSYKPVKAKRNEKIFSPRGVTHPDFLPAAMEARDTGRAYSKGLKENLSTKAIFCKTIQYEINTS